MDSQLRLFLDDYGDNLQYGETYFGIVVRDYDEIRSKQQQRHFRYVECISCGNVVSRKSSEIRSGKIRSCGCHAIRDQSEKHLKRQGYPPQLVSYYARLKRKAIKERNIAFELSKKEVFALVTKPCIYCGQEPSEKFYGGSRKKWKTPFIHGTIDRIDSSGFYIWHNCVPACMVCQRFKSNGTVDFMIEKARQIIEFHEKRLALCSSIENTCDVSTGDMSGLIEYGYIIPEV